MPPRPPDPQADADAQELARAFRAPPVEEPVPAAGITLEWLKVECGKLEGTLRDQFMDPATGEREPLPGAWEHNLERFPARSVGRGLQRWAYLKHLLWVVWDDLRPGAARDPVQADAAARLAAYQLVRAEPVEVDLGLAPGPVQVTDRSMAALVEIARHATRLGRLEDDLERAADIQGRLEARIRALPAPERRRMPWGLLWTRDPYGAERRRLVARLQWLRDIEVELLAEYTLHRRAIYAHAFTEDGGPAEGYEAAPAWWEQVTREGDVLLVQAVVEAGAGRAARLGEQPEPPRRRDAKGRWQFLEDWGWLAPPARWGLLGEGGVPLGDGAAFYNRRLGQATALLRLGAGPVWLEDASPGPRRPPGGRVGTGGGGGAGGAAGG